MRLKKGQASNGSTTTFITKRRRCGGGRSRMIFVERGVLKGDEKIFSTGGFTVRFCVGGRGAREETRTSVVSYASVSAAGRRCGLPKRWAFESMASMVIRFLCLQATLHKRLDQRRRSVYRHRRFAGCGGVRSGAPVVMVATSARLLQAHVSSVNSPLKISKAGDRRVAAGHDDGLRAARILLNLALSPARTSRSCRPV